MVDSKDYPEPANSVSGGLLLAHLNLLKFVPSVCVYPDLDYYNTLLIKTLGPLVVVALFWAWPLSKAIQGKPYAGSRGTAAKMSLFWLELVLLSVSTTIMQCFSCTNIGGRFYLRAQLILPCNGTGRRRAHILVAVLMVLLYPIGKEWSSMPRQAEGCYYVVYDARNVLGSCACRVVAGVPLLMFALMYPHRSQIQTLMEAVKAQDARRSSVTSVKRMKRASLAEIQTKLSWLIKKFKDYQPACWSHGIVVLVTRLCQTSLMVLCEKQATQAGFASAITLVAINVQRETRPYRRTSE